MCKVCRRKKNEHKDGVYCTADTVNYIKGKPGGKPSAKASAKKKRSRSRSKGKNGKDKVRALADNTQTPPQGGGQGGGPYLVLKQLINVTVFQIMRLFAKLSKMSQLS